LSRTDHQGPYFNISTSSPGYAGGLTNTNTPTSVISRPVVPDAPTALSRARHFRVQSPPVFRTTTSPLERQRLLRPRVEQEINLLCDSDSDSDSDSDVDEEE
jgi:hypothetical protein